MQDYRIIHTNSSFDSKKVRSLRFVLFPNNHYVTLCYTALSAIIKPTFLNSSIRRDLSFLFVLLGSLCFSLNFCRSRRRMFGRFVHCCVRRGSLNSFQKKICPMLLIPSRESGAIVPKDCTHTKQNTKAKPNASHFEEKKIVKYSKLPQKAKKGPKDKQLFDVYLLMKWLHLQKLLLYFQHGKKSHLRVPHPSGDTLSRDVLRPTHPIDRALPSSSEPLFFYSFLCTETRAFSLYIRCKA